MEALSSILLFVGLLIIWLAKKRDKEEKKERTIKRKPESIFTDIEEAERLENVSLGEDLKMRKLNGTLNESADETDDKVGVVKKLDRLPLMKRAIIWADILDKPISER